MEAAFALLLPLVAGYLYVSSCNGLKYRQSRDDGYRLYFRIAYFGLLLFLATAASLIWLYSFLEGQSWFQEIRTWAIEQLKPLLKEPDKAPPQLGFLLICVTSVGLGRVLPFFENWLLKRWKYRFLFKAAAQDDLELLLLEAALAYKSISVTTSSGKVYVGLVVQTGEPQNGRRMIALLPFMSGYRTEAGKVVFTTFYDEIYNELDQEEGTETDDFRLILPVDKLVSAAFFDLRIYEAFNAKASIAKPRRLRQPNRNPTNEAA